MKDLDLISFKKLQGHEGSAYLKELAHLRISVFKEFPYLYEGSLEYEEKYLKRYFSCEDALVVLAVNKRGEAVGMSSCLPMANEEEAFKRPFIANEFNPDEIFYFGESILLTNYRGLGAGKEFFNLREAHAQKVLGPKLKWTTFCAVERPLNHPLRPKSYQGPEGLWKKRGYEKWPSLIASYTWKDVDEEKESAKTLTYYLKSW